MDYFTGGLGYHAWRDLGISLLLITLAIVAGLLATRLLFWILGRLTGRTGFGWDNLALRHARRPVSLLFPLFFLNVIAPTLKLPGGGLRLLTQATSLLLILAIGYAFVSAVHFFRDLFLVRYDVSVADNLVARKVHTQIKVLEKVALTIIAVLTVAFMLMTFPGVRQVGVSLLASAGIAGLVIGLAAQKSIGNLLAGIQIAITQPIRIDDALLVEGEFGVVEEITLTYVVVRIWDLRRLVLPISYFIEKPFQNWTRTGANLLGTVMIYTDYTVPVEALRAEADRLVRAHPMWDGKVSAFQVLELKPESVEMRVLVSAESASKAFDLRASVRESMLAFIRENHPGCLPRTRVEVLAPAEGAPEPGAGKGPERGEIPGLPTPAEVSRTSVS
jgi:small-conductance mechanosensitive channel